MLANGTHDAVKTLADLKNAQSAKAVPTYRDESSSDEDEENALLTCLGDSLKAVAAAGGLL